jgi:hypothetical protein
MAPWLPVGPSSILMHPDTRTRPCAAADGPPHDGPAAARLTSGLPRVVKGLRSRAHAPTGSRTSRHGGTEMGQITKFKAARALETDGSASCAICNTGTGNKDRAQVGHVSKKAQQNGHLSVVLHRSIGSAVLQDQGIGRASLKVATAALTRLRRTDAGWPDRYRRAAENQCHGHCQGYSSSHQPRSYQGRGLRLHQEQGRTALERC